MTYTHLTSLMVVEFGILSAALSVAFHRSALPHMSSVVLKMGLAISIVGLINMLANMDDPTQIWPVVYIALTSSLYAIIFSVVAYLIDSNIPDNSGSEETPASSTAQRVISLLIWLFTLLAIISLNPSNIKLFFSIPATTMTLLGVIVLATIGQWSPTSSGVSSVANKLPIFGLIILWISNGGMLIYNQPKSLGPIMAIGFLTLFYAHIISTCIQLFFPSHIKPQKLLTQSIIIGGSLIGLFLAIYILTISF